MTINSIGHSDAISKYNSIANSTAPKSKPTANISDSVELSEGAQKFSALLKAAKETVETAGAEEESKAADIMARMQAGTYQVSSDDVTKDILNGYPSQG